MSELTQEEKTKALLATLWQKNLPIVEERIELLEAAANATVTGSLTLESRTDAIATAHKLAGALGMYGFPRGTELARNLEHQLEAEESLDPLTLRELTSALRESVGL